MQAGQQKLSQGRQQVGGRGNLSSCRSRGDQAWRFISRQVVPLLPNNKKIKKLAFF
jgi:hypothetical protein